MAKKQRKEALAALGRAKDVYKRQPKEQPAEAKTEVKPGGKAPAEAPKETTPSKGRSAPKAVSYTHLDVYKRQL